MAERDSRVGPSFIESMIDLPSSDALDERERYFNATSLPEEIFDGRTGTITRQAAHHTPNIKPLRGNINDISTDLIMEAFAQESQPEGSPPIPSLFPVVDTSQ